MSPIFRKRSREEDVNEIEEPDYDSMSSDEFFNDLVEEAASELDVSPEELKEMELSDIAEGLGTEIEEPYHPRGAREGYRDTNRLSIVSKEELKRRKEVVEERLGL